VALQRHGIIGWTVRQSVFQRRAGLATVRATTAAGAGAYAIRDVGTGTGLDTADVALPGLLAPFLERRSAADPTHGPIAADPAGPGSDT
jgi:putative membrane protein